LIVEASCRRRRSESTGSSFGGAPWTEAPRVLLIRRWGSLGDEDAVHEELDRTGGQADGVQGVRACEGVDLEAVVRDFRVEEDLDRRAKMSGWPACRRSASLSVSLVPLIFSTPCWSFGCSNLSCLRRCEALSALEDGAALPGPAAIPAFLSEWLICRALKTPASVAYSRAVGVALKGA